MADKTSRLDLTIGQILLAAVVGIVAACVFTALEPLFLGYRDPKLTLFCSTVISIGWFVWFRSKTMIDAGNKRIVLHRGNDYSDIGLGPVSIGFAKWTRRLLFYETKMRTVERSIRLQAKDGTFVTASLLYTWKPDQDNLAEFFSDDQENRIDTMIEVFLQIGAKNLSPKEIFSESLPKMDYSIPGVLRGGPVLSNFIPDSGNDMSNHVRDNSDLIQTIVSEVEDENRIEALRKYLKENYRDRHQRIDNLCNQRKAELRRRSLRA